jgi:hypothetical protein
MVLRATRFAVLAAALAAATAATAADESGGWRNSEADGQVQAFVSVDAGPSASGGSIYLGFLCGARPSVRLRLPVAGAPPGAKPASVPVTFRVGDDLFVAALDRSFTQAAGKTDLIAERGIIEDSDLDLVRDLATFLRDAPGAALGITVADPPLSAEVTLEGSKAALGRYLASCTALKGQ